MSRATTRKIWIGYETGLSNDLSLTQVRETRAGFTGPLARVLTGFSKEVSR